MGLRPTCTEVHRLVSEKLDRSLTPVERIRMHLHLAACDACRTFDHQMNLLRDAMRKLPAIDSSDAKREES